MFVQNVLLRNQMPNVDTKHKFLGINKFNQD